MEKIFFFQPRIILKNTPCVEITHWANQIIGKCEIGINKANPEFRLRIENNILI